MPFVRFSRDRRGYEHTYLVHESGGRGRPTRARVLYWFRTPPGIKVGREPFDDAARRNIESQNPGIAFDWKAIASTPMPPVPEVEHWRERRRAERAAKVARREEETDAIEVAAIEDAATVSETAPVGVAGQSSPVEVFAIAEASPESSSASVPHTDPPPQQDGGLPPESDQARKRRRRRGGRRRRVAGDPVAGSGLEERSADPGAPAAEAEADGATGELASSAETGESDPSPPLKSEIPADTPQE